MRGLLATRDARAPVVLLLLSGLLIAGCRQRTESDEKATANQATTASHADLIEAGHAALAQRTRAALFESLELFDAALLASPDATSALAGRSIASSLLALYDAVPPRPALERALADAEAAVRLDRGDALAEASLGLALYLGPHRYPEAQSALERAIELNPNDPSAYHWLAMLLSATGQHSEAIPNIVKARELAPSSLLYNTKVATLKAAAGDLKGAEEALAACQEALGDSALWQREAGWLAVRNGDLERARRHFEGALETAPHNDGIRAAAAFAAARSGDVETARAALEVLLAPLDDDASMVRSKVPEAIVLAGLADREGALRALDQALAVGDPGLIYIESQPAFESIRGEPDFREIVRSLGLPETLEQDGAARRG